jgi:hypothetical protein
MMNCYQRCNAHSKRLGVSFCIKKEQNGIVEMLSPPACAKKQTPALGLWVGLPNPEKTKILAIYGTTTRNLMLIRSPLQKTA